MADNPEFGVRQRIAAPKQAIGREVNGPAAGNGNADREIGRRRNSLLGPVHWLGLILYVTVIYVICGYLDDRLPVPLSAKEAGDSRFSEDRARVYLNSLTDIGPRPSGSDAADILARDFIMNEVRKIRDNMDKSKFRLDVDVQNPSGCFDLIFLSNFTLCYKHLTNVVVRLGRVDGLSAHSLLFNCHFDSVPQSPGATDDAISCAVMLELLNVFSHLDPKMLTYDIIFLFNGAEENFMQASHGFITSHPWRHSIRAFINLEGCGAGGREMLFQSGPANIWLLHAYLNSAPHPHCSIMAQEIFQSGSVPADTDFRVLRDFGHIPGMDIAYMKNGYLYHTEFDRPEFVADGALQRAGENLFATTLNMIQSPCFTRPCPQQETKLVYFDVMGLFVVQYPARIGALVNYSVVAMIVIRILLQIKNSNNGGGGYSAAEALKSLLVHVLAIILMAFTSFAMTRIVVLLDLTLCWYSWRPMVLVLYVVPAMVAGFMFHSLWRLHLIEQPHVAGGQYAERVTRDMALFIFALFLFGLTWIGLGSAYYALIHALFPLGRDVMTWIYGKVFGNQSLSAVMLLLFHGIALFPVIALGSYGALSVFEFFIPIMGRSGPMLNPENLIAFVGTACAVIIVLYMAGIVHISRAFGALMKIACAVTLLIIAVATLTDFGAPYVYDPKAPRPRRIHIQHVSRTIYAPDGRINSSDNALLIASLDYRGVNDLPATTFLQGSGPPPCVPEDAYCGLPYWVSVVDMFPPEKTLWMVVPSAPTFEVPISIKLTSSKQMGPGMVKMSFAVTGYDHMTLFVTPLKKWTLHSWSLTNKISERRKTYFLYFAYVGRNVGPWEFSLTLQKPPAQMESVGKDEPKLLLGVASHYFHGPHQYSPQTKSLIDSIRERRSKAPKTTGYWKWAMTPDAHNSEYVAKYF